jgi:hypothetical protein
MSTSQLRLHLNGAHFHPAEQQPTAIDLRYGETIDSEELPVNRLATTETPAKLNFGDLLNPRLVVIRNLAGAYLETFPDEEGAAALAKQVLRVGVLPAGENNPTAADLPLRLLPREAGRTLGGSQALWLADDVEVWIAPEDSEQPVLMRATIFPGNDPEPSSSSSG